MVELILLSAVIVCVIIVLWFLYEDTTLSHMTQKDLRPATLHRIDDGYESPIREGPYLKGKNFHFYLRNDELPTSIPFKNILSQNPINPNISDTGKKNFYYVSPRLAQHPLFRLIMDQQEETLKSTMKERDIAQDRVFELMNYSDLIRNFDYKPMKDLKDIVFYKSDDKKKEDSSDK